MPRTPRLQRPSLWSVLVPVVALVAGLLFATSSRTALGTDLRAGESSQLSGLIEQRDDAVARQQDELALLQQQVQELTDQAASRNGAVAEASAEGAVGLASAGLTPVSGPGLTVRLDDAPQGDGADLPSGATGDDLVIHQSDVQGVVNAMWAAGADGVAIMGQRLISTSAVICVGNTLLLQGRKYSPPFVVTAVGDADEMRRQLAASAEVQLLKQYVQLYGLTYEVADEREVDLPAYEGTLEMQYAGRAG
ncbi:DUF881 domain-containing protein [Modestobacter versicolor]|uniref:Uncharacterized protein YlxW (UPF0749 family) n=1 Tax=Modestobacter versicolor TaxID=429133 RepID=A0A323VX25_9ACTN|nr:DUF881 domain-containing protein [Modestobacter versicolor]MBB3677337.1 uncharacterized protein YlxW (UPF0749 family) [Modestobacter versicolor]PZA23308.1 hypothetical protein DMO24_00530 [Modestobacter versicolor]